MVVLILLLLLYCRPKKRSALVRRMESKGSTRSGNKPDAKIASSGKPEKPSPGPTTTTTDKKEAPPKEQPAPAATTPAKKVPAAPANEAPAVNNHSSGKPSSAAAATEGPEDVSHPANSEHKENHAEESPGSSIFENMKPLIIVGGAAVAVIAVIVGVAVLARKK
ncbi:UNVERIFIED_CONTAM: hypothetical protein K2H54_062034 [Gekko kuhli]